jgi:dTDP-4-amino-4,6-dideoxygalactose transaminase
MNGRRVMVGDYKIGQEEKDVIMEILDSGRISEYKYVAQFEREFAKIIGVKYCVLVNSGTSALIAALTALLYDERFPKIKKGAKVITTPLTYIATSNAIKLVGMEPAFVDVHLDTFDMIPEQVEAVLKNGNPDDFAMLLPVHLMGYPADMDALNAIAKKYGLVTFEDTAQAHGTKYKGKNTGTLSLIADYSFYIAHNIQVGEMGAAITNDEKLYRLIKKIKANGRMCDCVVCTRSQGTCPKDNLGSDPRFLHDMIGYNFKTMEFQAALGVLQLKRFDEIIRSRQDNVKYLNEGLKTFSDRLVLPKWDEAISYLAYPIVVRKGSGIEREALRKKLEKLGVENRPLFGSIPTGQPAYHDYKAYYEGKLPNADYLGENAFYIGCHQYLEKEDLDHIIDAFYEAMKFC